MIVSNTDTIIGVNNLDSVNAKSKKTSSIVNNGNVISPDLNSSEPLRLRSDQKLLASRQSGNSELNSIAKSIRTADNTMDKAADYISNMKEQLYKIVKQYPPFLAGSDERVEMKRGFDAFKSLIDKLTFPPKDDAVAAGIISGSAINPEAGFFEASIGDEGLVIKTTDQGSSVLPKSFDLPALSDNATDEEIEVIIEKLNIAENSLNNKRASLFSDAAIISDLINESSTIIKINPTFGEELKDNYIDETAAGLKSVEIKEDLKLEPASLTGSDDQIMQLLK